jgi:hypothetical protein
MLLSNDFIRSSSHAGWYPKFARHEAASVRMNEHLTGITGTVKKNLGTSISKLLREAPAG